MSPEERARKICELMEHHMRAMGLITTAHYDSGLVLIAEAIREAVAAERSACFRAVVEAISARRGGPTA
jgi:hypothetical protein